MKTWLPRTGLTHLLQLCLLWKKKNYSFISQNWSFSSDLRPNGRKSCSNSSWLFTSQTNKLYLLVPCYSSLLCDDVRSHRSVQKLERVSSLCVFCCINPIFWSILDHFRRKSHFFSYLGAEIKSKVVMNYSARRLLDIWALLFIAWVKHSPEEGARNDRWVKLREWSGEKEK